MVALTGSQVQAAEPSSVLPDVPDWETGSVSQDDMPERAFRLMGAYPGRLKIAGDSPAVRKFRATLTAYSSAASECDDSPFVTADGTRVRDGIVAANALEFGTRIRIPELFGDKVFEVRDRMNKRYRNRMDIWMESAADGRKFGIKRGVLVEVLR